MTSESLREQVEKQLNTKELELLNRAMSGGQSKAYMDGIVDGIEIVKELVKLLIDEKAKEAETRITLLKNMERVVDGKYYGDLIDGQIVGIEMTLARLAGKRG